MATIKKQLTLTFKQPNIAGSYGPYASRHEAHAALSEDQLNVVGMTVGIQTGDTIEEYWYQGGIYEGNLVKKQVASIEVDANPTQNSPNAVSSDGVYNAVENLKIKFVGKGNDNLPLVSNPIEDTIYACLRVQSERGGNSTYSYFTYKDNEWQNISQGPKGDGNFTFIKFSEDMPAQDSDIHDLFNPSSDRYIGVYNGLSSEAPANYQEYNWGKFNGASALDIYNELNPNAQLDKAGFIAKLQQKYPMKHAGYYETSVEQTIGTPFTGALDGDELLPTSNTMGNLYIMPNSGTTPTGSIAFTTINTGENQYAWVSLGAVEVPDNALTKEMVDNECTNGTVDTPASANVVMGLKKKLQGVTFEETKVENLTDYTPDGESSTGYYKSDGTWQDSSNYVSTRIDVHGCDSIRFLGYATKSSTIYYGFEDENGDIITKTLKNYGDNTLASNVTILREYTINVPSDAYYFVCLYDYGGSSIILKPSNFYCYLQSGTNVGEELADKASYSEMEGLWMWKKNLINQDDLLVGGVYVSKTSTDYEHDENGYTTGYPNGIMSNKIVLEDGVTYTASNVNAYKTSPYTIDSNCTINISRFNSEGEFLGNILYTGTLKKTDSNASKNTANATFTYKKHRNAETGEIDEAYCRIRLRFNASSNDSTWDDYKNAQLEVGTEVTELAPYHSEKVFNIAKKSEIEQSLSELEQKHDTDVENINNKFKYSDYIEIGNDGYYTVEDKYLRYLVSSGSMEKTVGSNTFVAKRYRLYPVEEGVDYYFTGSINTGTNWPEYPIIFLPGTTDIELGYSGSLNKEDALGVGFGAKDGKIVYKSLWSKDKAKLTIPNGCNTIAINIWDKASISLSPFILYKYVENEYNLGDLNNKIEAKGEKQTLNILVLGHSNAQDTMTYVPYLYRNLKLDKQVDVNFGILYLGSSGIANHINNFEYRNTPYDAEHPSNTHNESNTGVPISGNYVTMKNNGQSYVYSRFFADDEDWVNGPANYSIQYVLRRNKWDIILMPANEYAAQTHILMQYIIDYVSINHKDEDANAVEPYTVKFGVINFASMVVTANGSQWTGPSDKTHGVPLPEADPDDPDFDPDNPAQGTLQYKWKVGVESGADVLDRTLYEFIIPANAAVCNALTVDEIKKFGDYAYHVNNTNYIDNEDHSAGCYGYLRAPDGVHLQEGLPCQIVAYAVICKILELIGMDYFGILGDTTICNNDWIEDKSIPGYNPQEDSGPSYSKKYTSVDVLAKSTTGWSDDEDINLQRVFFAQKCAIMAVKKPFEITDMNNFYGEKHPIMFYAPHASRDNIVSIIDDGKPYSTEITAKEGYAITSTSVIVKINNEDITSTVYDSLTHTITIDSVTGKVQILVNATEQSN